MGSIIGHRIDYIGVGVLRGPAVHTQQKLTQVTPRGVLHHKHYAQVDEVMETYA